MSLIENAMSERTQEATPLLAIEGLSTHLGSDSEPVRAVDDVSLRIHRGETFVLLGESGCGKSMIALSIMRLLPHSGRIVAGDVEASALWERVGSDDPGLRMPPPDSGKRALSADEFMTAGPQ